MNGTGTPTCEATPFLKYGIVKVVDPTLIVTFVAQADSAMKCMSSASGREACLLPVHRFCLQTAAATSNRLRVSEGEEVPWPRPPSGTTI
mmetsp:Transcript_7630/g.11508  ORF Transcript_7630/g.11508 Transcript_7630/m.11508 type:complete len:90 (+) Transcript_7630:130-399(+)